MEDIIAIVIIVLILFLAIFYIIRTKKKGQKCIGCPYAKECGKNQGSCCDKNSIKEYYYKQEKENDTL